MGLGPWPRDLEEHTGYSPQKMRAAVEAIRRLHAAAVSDKLQAVRKKYAQLRFGAVSGIPLATSLARA